MSASRYWLQAGEVTGMALYVSPTTSAGNVQCAIFSDNANSPDALLATSADQAMTDGWNNLAISYTIPADGYYWLAFQHSANGPWFRYDVSGAPANSMNNFTGVTYGTWPANWAGGVTATALWSMYVENCVQGTQTFTPTVTQTWTATSTPTFTGTETSTGTDTPTYTPTGTGSPTDTSTLTFTPTYTATPSATDTATGTFTGTATGTNTETATPTSTPTYTHTLTETPTFTGTPTLTLTLTSSYTYTPLPTSSFTATNSITMTITITFTPTYTYTPLPTSTFTATRTDTPTFTETSTPLPTSTFTATNSITMTITITSTLTYTYTPPPTSTDTPPNTVTETHTATPTYTITQTYTASPTPDIVAQLDRNHFNSGAGETVQVGTIASAGMRIALKAYNLTGEMVRKHEYTAAVNGWNYVTWDGRNDAGKLLGRGLYFIHVTRSDGREVIKRVYILK